MSSSVQKLSSFALVALTFAIGACQAVAGIEERRLDPALEPVRIDSEQCKDYCTVVMGACTLKNAVYANEAQCLGVCAALDPGDSEEQVGNTVACRAKRAADAVREPDGNCRSAGPGGDDVCGSDCDAYCQLYPIICKDTYTYGSKADCLRACGALAEQASYNLDDDHEGDTIECRLVHTASAASAAMAAETHCPHAPIPPAQPWCTGKADAAPTCKEYCDIHMAVCLDELQQYESPEQCMAVCAELPPGNNADKTGNTIGCRRYHAFSASIGPRTHCHHSGPTGDGHCGDPGRVPDGHTGNCESYCMLVAAACPALFKTTMGSPETCMTACVSLPDADYDSLYSLQSAAESKGLSCRILHTARALEGKPAACASALGGDECK